MTTFERLESQPFQHRRFLYLCAVSLTPMMFLNVLPLPKSNIVLATEAIWALLAILIVISALFTLAPKVNHILKDNERSHRRMVSLLYRAYQTFFFIWVLELFSMVTNWVSPQALASETVRGGLSTAAMSVLAGPLEEIWRWTFVLSLFYVGMNWISRKYHRGLFMAMVGVSCALFGMGHIGQLKGHPFATWLILSLMGLALFLVAYIAKSLWIAILVHSLYDILVSVGILPSVPGSWWLIGGVPFVCIIVLQRLYRRHSEISSGPIPRSA